MNNFVLHLAATSDEIEPGKPELNGFRLNNRAIEEKYWPTTKKETEYRLVPGYLLIKAGKIADDSSAWHPMSEIPEADGVYQVQDPSEDDYYSLWREGIWHGVMGDVDRAAKAINRSYTMYNGQVTGWRPIQQP